MNYDSYFYDFLEEIKSSSATPKPRAAHTCDCIDDFLYLFGGCTGLKVLNDLWLFDIKNFKWQEVIDPGEQSYKKKFFGGPTPRNNHASTVWNSIVFIHGGHDGSKWLDDMYALETTKVISSLLKSCSKENQFDQTSVGALTTNNKDISNRSISIDMVPDNHNVSIWNSFSNNNQDSTHSRLLACHELIEKLNCDNTDETNPRDGMSLIANKDIKFTVSERRDSQLVGFATHSSLWSKLMVGGPRPLQRACHTLNTINNKLYMFGGYDGSKCFNDMNIFDIHTGSWIRPLIKSQLPAPRNAHTMTTLSSCSLGKGLLLLIGGHNGKQNLIDSFLFVADTLTWCEILFTCNMSPGLRGHCGINCGNDFYIIGGYNGTKMNRNLCCINLESMSCKRNIFNDSLKRQRHTATLISQTQVIIFGGYNGHAWLQDSYLLNLDKLYDSERKFSNIQYFLDDLQKLIDNEHFFTDMSFVVEGKSIKCHKCILAASSQYFHNLIKSDMMEKDSKQIVIDDPQITYDSFYSLILYFYTARIPENAPINSLLALLRLSDKYMVERLKKSLEENILTRLDKSNCILLLIVSDELLCPILKSRCLDFLLNNPAAFPVDSFMNQLESYPSLCAEITKLSLARSVR